jgi:uncharacterized protein (DUF1800 family)
MAALSACQPRNQASTSGSSHSGLSAQSITINGQSAPHLSALVVSDEILIPHTLRRITFGPTPAEMEHARQIGLNAFLDEQFSDDTSDTPAIQQQLSPFTTFNMTYLERRHNQPPGAAGAEIVKATLIRQINSPHQLFEQLVDFWSNHFNVYILKGRDKWLKTDDDRDVIRKYALGKFGDLLNASAHSPAMLNFLDNASNDKHGPNENYARELMELHTISVNANYTSDDVKEMARCLTGWMFNSNGFVFTPARHDDGEKTVIGIHIPAGGGIKDGEQILQVLSSHPMTAQFIAYKLARRFVSDDPADSIIAKVAATFNTTGGDIRQMMRTILASDEFKSSIGQKTKRPLDFILSVARSLEIDTSAPHSVDTLLSLLKQMGQLHFHWESPNGYPEAGAAWVNTSGTLYRWNFALALTANKIPDIKVDLPSLVKGGQSPADVVDLLSLRLLGEKLPDDARNILVDFATGGQLVDKVPAVAGLIIGSPHFQLR